MRSYLNYLYIKKLHKFPLSYRGEIELEDKYGSKFGLFFGTYFIAYALFALLYFGQTPFHQRFNLKIYNPKPGFETLYKIKEDIPPEASVSVPSDIGVLLCERNTVYLFPKVNNAEYIVFDMNHVGADEYWALFQVVDILKNGMYGIFKKRGRFVILKRGLPLDGVEELINEINSRSYK
ncbi:hypothetical protein KKB18_10585 [bacterium]|nr:hypothetical protein [bacterium]